MSKPQVSLAQYKLNSDDRHTIGKDILTILLFQFLIGVIKMHWMNHTAIRQHNPDAKCTTAGNIITFKCMETQNFKLHSCKLWPYGNNIQKLQRQLFRLLSITSNKFNIGINLQRHRILILPPSAITSIGDDHNMSGWSHYHCDWWEFSQRTEKVICTFIHLLLGTALVLLTQTMRNKERESKRERVGGKERRKEGERRYRK